MVLWLNVIPNKLILLSESTGGGEVSQQTGMMSTASQQDSPVNATTTTLLHQHQTSVNNLTAAVAANTAAGLNNTSSTTVTTTGTSPIQLSSPSLMNFQLPSLQTPAALQQSAAHLHISSSGGGGDLSVPVTSNEIQQQQLQHLQQQAVVNTSLINRMDQLSRFVYLAF